MSKPADKPERLGDAPIEPSFVRMMQSLAGILDEAFNGTAKGDNRKVGFILMTFNFGSEEDGRTNYISNARREDVVAMLKHQLARFEGQPELKGHA